MTRTSSRRDAQDIMRQEFADTVEEWREEGREEGMGTEALLKGTPTPPPGPIGNTTGSDLWLVGHGIRSLAGRTRNPIFG